MSWLSLWWVTHAFSWNILKKCFWSIMPLTIMSAYYYSMFLSIPVAVYSGLIWIRGAPPFVKKIGNIYTRQLTDRWHQGLWRDLQLEKSCMKFMLFTIPRPKLEYIDWDAQNPKLCKTLQNLYCADVHDAEVYVYFWRIKDTVSTCKDS